MGFLKYKRYNKDSREKNQAVRMKVIEALGGKCVRCGFCDWRALQVDHIDNDGCLDSPSRKRNYATLQIVESDLNKEKKRLQLLCANCHSIKRHEKLEELKKLPGNVWKNYRKEALEASQEDPN